MKHSASMISQGSQIHSAAGGGSVLGGGFQFEDDEVGVDIEKKVRKIQKPMIRELDNKAVLLSYGIDTDLINTRVERQPTEERKSERLL